MAAAALSLWIGSVVLPPGQVLAVLIGWDSGSTAARIVLYSRLPRTCAALLAGAALAVSGTVIQTVLGNQLASPSIIGVNSGAGLAVAVVCAAAPAVSFSGLLSFVGLIVPHTMRRLLGEDSLPLLVSSAIGGAFFVTACDLLARVLFAPFELPVGIVLAFAGAPFFLWLLFRQRGGRA